MDSLALEEPLLHRPDLSLSSKKLEVSEMRSEPESGKRVEACEGWRESENTSVALNER